MQTIQSAFLVLAATSAAAYLVCWFLTFTRLVASTAPLAISLGASMLSIGLYCLCGAASKEADRGGWGTKARRSNVRVGRLSQFAFGIFFASIGVAFLGYDWLPKPYRVSAFLACVASWVLAWIGASLEARRSKPEREGAGDLPSPHQSTDTATTSSGVRTLSEP